MKQICKIAKTAENQIAEILELERKRPGRWRVMETTLTDMVIALFSGCELPDVWIDTPDETITGGDIDLILYDRGEGIRFVIQAKRADEAKTKSPYFWYRELFHPDQTGAQCESLVNYCKSENAIPLYAFYHPKSLASTLTNSDGISLCHAQWINTESNVAGDRSNKKSVYYDPVSFRFTELFCHYSERQEWRTLAELLAKLKRLVAKPTAGWAILSRSEAQDKVAASWNANLIQEWDTDKFLEWKRQWQYTSEGAAERGGDESVRDESAKIGGKIVVGLPQEMRDELDSNP